MMTKEDIINAQKEWSEGIIKMGKLSKDRSSLELFVNEFLDKLYDFDNQVLFKPTKAKEVPFRNNKELAISYFIAGNNRKCIEDNGFALSNWSKITFNNSDIILIGETGLAMGNYTFKNEASNIKVEYSFVYKNYGDQIKIILHHSSLPYKI